MFVGFDYGTSNCAMSYLTEAGARLIPLYGDNAFVPSTLYALERSFIAELIAQHIDTPVTVYVLKQAIGRGGEHRAQAKCRGFELARSARADVCDRLQFS